MNDFSVIEIAKGIDFVSVPADRFKTNEIKISFCLPLSADTASRNAVLISLLSNSSKEYPTLTDINKKLAYLYGASLTPTIQKVGENQVVSLSISCLDDKFSLGDKISEESIDMLLSLIFSPKLDDNGDFCQSDLDREKRIIIERIESEDNEKRVYSLRRLEQIMFEGEAFAVNRFGSIDSVKALTVDDIKLAYTDILTKAKIQLTVVGCVDNDAIADKLSKAFASVDRCYVAPVVAQSKPARDEINTVVERIDVKQGKLVLGYRVALEPTDSMTIAMRSFCDTFGGGPYSKLFANVREKLSLCYYCSARYDRRKSCIIIQCGCEEENMDKAIAEIQNQLDEIRNGNFAEELASSKIGLSDAINSSNDDSLMLSAWYGNQIVDSRIKSPSQSALENNAVLASDVQACASLIKLDTVFKLCSAKEDE